MKRVDEFASQMRKERGKYLDTEVVTVMEWFSKFCQRAQHKGIEDGICRTIPMQLSEYEHLIKENLKQEGKLMDQIRREFSDLAYYYYVRGYQSGILAKMDEKGEPNGKGTGYQMAT